MNYNEIKTVYCKQTKNLSSFHTGTSHSWLFCPVTSFNLSPLELPVPVLPKIHHHAGHQVAHCEGKTAEAFHN